MERYLTAVGIRSLHLIVGGICIPCVGYGPHGGIGIFEAGILHVVLPLYRYRRSNFAAVIQRTGNSESTTVLRVNSSHIIRIPGNGNLFFGPIVVNDTYGIRKLGFCTEIAGYGKRRDTLHCQGRRSTVFQILKYIQRSQRMSGEIKHCLIIPRASAVILSGILRIVIGSVAACPAAAVFFPNSGIVSICGTYRDPGAFPVEDAFSTGFAGCCTDIPYFICLSLNTGGIAFCKIVGSLHVVGGSVAVFCGIAISIFSDIYLFAISIPDMDNCVFQIIHGSMPARIEGETDNIVINLFNL